ncbi:hypothetical protein KAI92_00600 [Candidatus Parcubacteria bacterium]|nr:hypothetical protein [Candidatus Parcubacteria bacterium]
MDAKLATMLVFCLKSEDEILDMMKKTYYDNEICDAGIPKLKLHKKSGSEILDTVKNTDYDRRFCEKIAYFLYYKE